jgi:ferredoxin
MIDIFYFSGTGYSLKAAKLLREELGSEAVLKPMVGALSAGRIESSAEAVGIVVPMHAFGLPELGRAFLAAARFPACRYLFALVVRGGAPTRVRREIESLLRPRGRRLDAFRYATAPNTFDAVFPFPTPPEVEIERKRFDEDVRGFARVVAARESRIDEGYRNLLLENLVFPVLRFQARSTRYFRLESAFFADDACTGCGECARMCLSGKIEMRDGRPTWKADIRCLHCLACVHRCPSEAVRIRDAKVPEAPRTPCREISDEEIAAEKSGL